MRGYVTVVLRRVSITNTSYLKIQHLNKTTCSSHVTNRNAYLYGRIGLIISANNVPVLQRDDFSSSHADLAPKEKHTRYHFLTLTNINQQKSSSVLLKSIPNFSYLDTSFLNHRQVSNFWTKCRWNCLVPVPMQLYPNLGNSQTIER